MSAQPLALLVLFGVGVSGCIVKNAAVDPACVTFVEGRTTRKDVVSVWGNPDSVKDDVWCWKDWRTVGGKAKLGYMGVGFTVSNAQMATYEYHLTFDDHGILRRQKLFSALHEGPVWCLVPED